MITSELAKDQRLVDLDVLEANYQANRPITDRIATIYFTLLPPLMILAFSGQYWSRGPTLTPTNISAVALLVLASIVSLRFYRSFVARLQDSASGQVLSIALPFLFFGSVLLAVARDSLVPLVIGLSGIAAKSWQLERLISSTVQRAPVASAAPKTRRYLRQLAVLWTAITALALGIALFGASSLTRFVVPLDHTAAFNNAQSAVERLRAAGCDTGSLTVHLRDLETIAITFRSPVIVAVACLLLFGLYRLLLLHAAKIVVDEVLGELRAVYRALRPVPPEVMR
jgi:hypothetical protein